MVSLNGGNTSFDGFDERIRREITMLLPQSTKFSVSSLSDGLLGPYKGKDLKDRHEIRANITFSTSKY